MIFTPDQKKQLRDMRSGLKVLGQLDHHQPDTNHWLGAAGIARAALTIIQVATGIDSSLDSAQAATLAAASITEGVQAQVEEWTTIIETEYEIEISAAQQAIEEIFDELYGQLVEQVELLENIAAQINPAQVSTTEQPLQDSDDGWSDNPNNPENQPKPHRSSARYCSECGHKYPEDCTCN